MLLDELLTFFQSKGIGTPGTTLFAGSQATLPNTDGPLTVVAEYGGLPAIRGMGVTVVAEQPRAQVMVHAKTYSAARTKVEAAYRACLHACDAGSVAISGATYLAMNPLQPPFDIGADDNGRVMLGFNISVSKKVSP